MGRIIAIANQKGGVGKTTTAINLAAALAAKGKKVLAVDMDSQGNLTSGFGVDKDNLEYTIYETLIGECNIGQSMLMNVVPNLNLIPSSQNLAGAEVDFIDLEQPQYVLKEIIHKVRKNFDFIIIDCPPALGMLTINSMTAADTVIVPIQCEFYALEGLSQLIATIRQVKRRYNPMIEIEGVLLTMFDGRLNLTHQVVDQLKEYFPKKVYSTPIPRNVKLSEAPSFGQPIMYYDKRSKGTEAYMDVADEFLRKN